MPERRRESNNGRLLLILRHGKSDWEADYGADFSRPLAPRGEKAAHKVGRYLAQSGLEPELIVTSPARRALATAEIVATEVGIDDIEQSAGIYGGDYEELAQIVARMSDDLRCVLLVGHNPGLEELVAGLTGETFVELKTCSLAVLKGQADSWDALGATPFTLQGIYHPRELAEE